jgi:hypothetical protein
MKHYPNHQMIVGLGMLVCLGNVWVDLGRVVGLGNVGWVVDLGRVAGLGRVVGLGNGSRKSGRSGKQSLAAPFVNLQVTFQYSTYCMVICMYSTVCNFEISEMRVPICFPHGVDLIF